jgi:hypothetical protein
MLSHAVQASSTDLTANLTAACCRSDAEDTRFGMHVCVGGSSATTVGGMSGGLAFTGAWGQLGSGLQPVLVFPE